MSNDGGGVGILGLLGVAFIILKLMGYIGWSWWWVLAPFWGGGVLVLLVGLAFLGVYLGRRRPQRRTRRRI